MLTFGLCHCVVWWITAKLHGVTSQKMEGSMCIIFNISMSTDIRMFWKLNQRHMARSREGVVVEQ
jgi:hypothetical protein